MVNPKWTSTPIEASQSVIRFDHPDFDPKLGMRSTSHALPAPAPV
jgi:hypothetical protein